MDWIKYIAEIKDIALSTIIIVGGSWVVFQIIQLVKMVITNYPIWKKAEQEAKDKRAEMYSQRMEKLAESVNDIVKINRDGFTTVLEHLSTAAAKQQIRHESVMSYLGSATRDIGRPQT